MIAASLESSPPISGQRDGGPPNVNHTEPSALFETSADYFRFFANESLRGGSPLYEKLSLGIADDVAVQRLAATRKKGQPAANLMLGAVHYLLLSGVKHDLGDYYPSLGGTRPADDEAFKLFRAFCQSHETDVVDIIAKRVTNTNEVGRSSLLAPAFQIVSSLANAPLALIEIGSSAGLNLNFDRYGYRYVDESGATRLERWSDSGLVLECTLESSDTPQLAESPPPVGSRLGLELQPIDITREDERLWLKALVWPERTDRFARLDGALKIAAVHPPTVKGGDATLNLAEALASVSVNQVRCVYHTVMFYQMSQDQAGRVHNALLSASHAGPIFRVSVEGEVSERNPKETHNPLKILRYHNGQLAGRTLAVCDPHGTSMEWQAA